MEMFWSLASAVLGLVVGSFLNVVINRLKAGKSLNGRSECPHCHAQLSAKDLFPVLSFFLLRGKCRSCGQPISRQYPIVEALTGLVFLLIAWHWPVPGLDAIFVAILAAFFIVIAVYDFKHYLILDKVIWPGMGVALAYVLYQDFSMGCVLGLNLSCATVSGLWGSLSIGGFFYAQYAASNGRWIGFGDVKLGLLLGLAVGFPLSLFLMFVGYMAGAVTGIALIVMGRKEMGSKLPFGTFLALAAIFTLLYGEKLMGLYLDLIGL